MMVADSGPLAVLFKAGLLGILEALHGAVLVPRAVERELLMKPEGIVMFRENPWITPTEVKNRELVKMLMLVVDEGEAEAIALALHSGARILIDERKGRETARKLGLEVRGTLGLFVEAKNKGVIKNVKDCIDSLVDVGYFLETDLIEEVIRKANEF
jgi:predicted nucleic acid-binding protein